MIEIMGKKYLTDKEAASRYGYSQSWFIRARFNQTGPTYAQFNNTGRVLYPLEETDEWFQKMLIQKQ